MTENGKYVTSNIVIQFTAGNGRQAICFFIYFLVYIPKYGTYLCYVPFMRDIPVKYTGILLLKNSNLADVRDVMQKAEELLTIPSENEVQ